MGQVGGSEEGKLDVKGREKEKQEPVRTNCNSCFSSLPASVMLVYPDTVLHIRLDQDLEKLKKRIWGRLRSCGFGCCPGQQSEPYKGNVYKSSHGA